ncbi:MAG: hypothetical protein DELT_01918 [Desulfovibrio sp.]
MLISNNGQKILKIFHLFAVCFWVGGGMGLLLLLYAAKSAASSDELVGILRSYRFVNVIVTVYMGAYASFFTGLAYSLCTNRGFFRHKWIIAKWVMTVAMIAAGMAFLGPWSTQMLEMAITGGLHALRHPDFIRIYELHTMVIAAYMALFVVATVLSVYKPWEREEQSRHQPPPLLQHER